MFDKTKRIRGRKLTAIRQRLLRANGLCVLCSTWSHPVVAVEIDHIIPLFKGGTEDDSNKQGLCSSCHAQKTAADMGYVAKQAVGLDGFPIDGGRYES